MNKPLFVDANIPMYAHGTEHPYRSPCKAALKYIVDNQIPAAISSEIVQEIIHRYLSLQCFEQGIQVAQDTMILIPQVLPVTQADIRLVLRLIPQYPTLQARDLVHVAVMLNNGLSHILSTDAHFDRVNEIQRIDPHDLTP